MTALCPPGPVVRRVLVPVTPGLPLGPFVSAGTELLITGGEPGVVATTEWLGSGELMTTGALVVGLTALVVTGAWLTGAGTVETGAFVVGAWIVGTCVFTLCGPGASVVGVLTRWGTFTCGWGGTVGTTGVEGAARACADSNGAANMAATAATTPIVLIAKTGALLVFPSRVDDQEDELARSKLLRRAPTVRRLLSALRLALVVRNFYSLCLSRVCELRINRSLRARHDTRMRRALLEFLSARSSGAGP
jgi:hypothetical protein